MSIQAGWNNALGILGGISYLKDIRKGQTLKPYEKPRIDIQEEVSPDIVASMRKQMTEEGTVPGSGTQEEKTFDKTVDELLDRKTGTSISAYKDYPEDARQKAIEENMDINTAAKEGVSPKTVMLKKQLAGYEAALRAQEAAQVADSAPKNTMSPIIEQLKKNTKNIPTIANMTGGER